VRASDGGTPAKSAEELVKVAINRNFKTPVWTQLNYQKTVHDTQQIDVSILQLSAKDEDTKVCINFYDLIVLEIVKLLVHLIEDLIAVCVCVISGMMSRQQGETTICLELIKLYLGFREISAQEKAE
jgi:hypothetical protein